MGIPFFKKPAFRYAVAGFALSIVSYGVYTVGVPVAHEFNDSFAMKEFKQYGVFGTYQKHFFSFLGKFDEMANLEFENQRLKSDLALLEKKQTLEEASRAEEELAAMNAVLEKKVKAQAGSEEAHLPQSIGYELPDHLVPNQLYTLALAYFRKQEFEKTAVIFDHLFNLADDHRYETAENYLISGISWYHLKNYTLSRKQVGEATVRSHTNDTVHRQAALWDAMIEKAEGHEKVAQATLLRFIGQYPHSVESTWINGGRGPAATREGHENQHVMPSRQPNEEHVSEETKHSEATVAPAKEKQKEDEHEE